MSINEYSFFTFNHLYNICNKHQFFTSGTNEQYSKLFEHNDAHEPIRELALIIYICTPSHAYTLAEIENILKKEHKIYED